MRGKAVLAHILGGEVGAEFLSLLISDGEPTGNVPGQPIKIPGNPQNSLEGSGRSSKAHQL